MPQFIKPTTLDECDSFTAEYKVRVDEYIDKCNSLERATEITVADMPVLVLNSRTRPIHRAQIEQCKSLQEQIDYVNIIYVYAIRGLESEIEIVDNIKQELSRQAA